LAPAGVPRARPQNKLTAVLRKHYPELIFAVKTPSIAPNKKSPAPGSLARGKHPRERPRGDKAGARAGSTPRLSHDAEQPTQLFVMRRMQRASCATMLSHWRAVNNTTVVSAVGGRKRNPAPCCSGRTARQAPDAPGRDLCLKQAITGSLSALSRAVGRGVEHGMTYYRTQVLI
jgi:hypothetical protein